MFNNSFDTNNNSPWKQWSNSMGGSTQGVFGFGNGMAMVNGTQLDMNKFGNDVMQQNPGAFSKPVGTTQPALAQPKPYSGPIGMMANGDTIDKDGNRSAFKPSDPSMSRSYGI